MKSRAKAFYLLPHQHLLGTDLNGRDLLYRVLLGAQISLLVGITGALVSFAVGIVYGMVAGYVGGQADSIMMRLVDTLYAIPRLIFVLVLITALDPLLRHAMAAHGLQGLIGYSKIFILILCLGLTEWLTMARIVRGQILSLKSQQFVLAARSIGQSHFNIIFQHLIAEPGWSRARLSDSHGPCCDSGRIISQLSGGRCPSAACELGIIAQRRGAGDQSDQRLLVVTGIPGDRHVFDASGPELLRRWSP